MDNGTSQRIRSGFGDALIPLHAHIAFFWETEEEFATALNYLEEGLRGTDHCVIFGHEKANLRVCRILADRGLDLEDLETRGRLALVGASDTGDATLESIAAAFSRMVGAGATVLRLLGNIGWLEQRWPSVRDLLAMEAKVTVAAEKFPCVILCLYDMSAVPALIMLHGGMETHPWTFRGASLYKNPFCVPVETAVKQLDLMSETLIELERKKEALQLYQLMFARTRNGLLIVSTEPGKPRSAPRVVDMNPAALKFSGRSGSDFSGSVLAELFPGLFDRELEVDFDALAAGGGSKDLGEAAIGKRRFRVVLFALFDNFLGIVLSDITKRKRAEAEIAKLLAKVQNDAEELEKRVVERTAQLEEKNRELDSFAHSVSHDLRAPLRAVRGFTEILLEDGTQKEAERIAHLKRILAAAQGMDLLIQDLLAYSRLGRQEIVLKPVSLEQVVRDAVRQLELESAGRQYRLEISGELPEVLGQHAVLVQVVLNLMANAIKFVPEGVTPQLRIWAEKADGARRLFVQDNGIGIAPQHQERIFKIFERLQGVEAYPGTGVGLAIVRKAVTRLGGRVGLESREGEGSRFWIELRDAGEGPPTGESI
jgi:signal transduction histidine kinase